MADESTSAAIAGGAIQAAGQVGAAMVNSSGNRRSQERAKEYNKELMHEQYVLNQASAIEAYERNLRQWYLENEEFQRRFEQQKQTNIEQYQREQQGNIDFWQMQNEYNKPSAQVQRMLEAGMSPNAANIDAAGGDLSAPDVASVAQAGVANSPQMQYSNAPGYPVSPTPFQMDNPLAGAASIIQNALALKEKKRMDDALIGLYEANAAKSQSEVDKNNAFRPYWDTYFRGLTENQIFGANLKDSQSQLNFLKLNFETDAYDNKLQALSLANKLLGSQIAQVDANTSLINVKKECQEIFNKYADDRYKSEKDILEMRYKVGFISDQIRTYLVSGKDKDGNPLSDQQRYWLLAVNGILPSLSSIQGQQYFDDLFQKTLDRHNIKEDASGFSIMLEKIRQFLPFVK